MKFVNTLRNIATWHVNVQVLVRLLTLLLHRLADLVAGNHAHNPSLFRHVFEYAQHFSVPADKPKFGIYKALFSGKFFHQDAGLA